MSKPTKGIIYYNAGLSCIVRLATSISTLKRCYSGPITIISEQGPGDDECRKLAEYFSIDIKSVVMPDKDKNQTMLNRTLLHTVTPYDITLNIDSDTIVRRDPSRLFNLAKEFEFVVCAFCDWTSKARKIRKRVVEWEKWYPQAVKDSAELGPALNCGVFAFTRNSKWMAAWYDLAKVNRKTFIPDEKCCQLWIHAYPHYIADQRYNCSTIHAEVNDSSHILHMHGKKHCQIIDGKYLYHSDLWYEQFEKVRCLKVVKDCIQHDRRLRKFVKVWDNMK